MRVPRGLTAIILALGVLFAIAGCGGSDGGEPAARALTFEELNEALLTEADAPIGFTAVRATREQASPVPWPTEFGPVPTTGCASADELSGLDESDVFTPMVEFHLTSDVETYEPAPFELGSLQPALYHSIYVGPDAARFIDAQRRTLIECPRLETDPDPAYGGYQYSRSVPLAMPPLGDESIAFSDFNETAMASEGGTNPVSDKNFDVVLVRRGDAVIQLGRGYSVVNEQAGAALDLEALARRALEKYDALVAGD
jgi:hypothetical protein